MKHLRATYSEEPGISVYKLCHSNDGWWVTKIECQRKGTPYRSTSCAY